MRTDSSRPREAVRPSEGVRPGDTPSSPFDIMEQITEELQEQLEKDSSGAAAI